VRMGRIFRLVNSAKTLKKLFNTIIASVPSLLNVCGLLSILMFVFAVLGMQMFATVPETDDITEHANFRNFWDSLHSLLRYSTGENWNGVMHEMITDPDDTRMIGGIERKCHSTDPKQMKDDKIYPKIKDTKPGIMAHGWCDWGMTEDIMVQWNLNQCTQADIDSGTYEYCCRELNGCGDETLLRAFFYLFTIVVTFVMFNLVIGIILDAFDGEGQEETSMLSEDNLHIFVEDWSKFDEDASYCIKLSQMRDFFQLLDAPMGFGEEISATDEQLLFHILELGLVIRESNVEPELGEIRFDIYDVASALGRRVCRLEAERKSEKPGTVCLDPDEDAGIPLYLKGVSHSPAREVILTFFEMTYGVVPSAPAAPARASAPAGDSAASAKTPAEESVAPSAAAPQAPPLPPQGELAPVTGPGATKPAETGSAEGAQT